MALKNEDGLAVLAVLAVVMLAWAFFANFYGLVSGFPWNFLYDASAFALGFAAGRLLRRW